MKWLSRALKMCALSTGASFQVKLEHQCFKKASRSFTCKRDVHTFRRNGGRHVRNTSGPAE